MLESILIQLGTEEAYLRLGSTVYQHGKKPIQVSNLNKLTAYRLVIYIAVIQVSFLRSSSDTR